MRNFLLILFCGLSTFVRSQDCEIPMAVVMGELGENIPASSLAVLEASLNRIAVNSGINTSFRFSNIILTAKVDILGKDVLAGPPIQISRTLGITFYMADVSTRTKFSSSYVEVIGVGSNDVKCFNDAFKRFNQNLFSVKQMLSEGKSKILSYYNDNYDVILKEAQRRVTLQKYEEAIALAVSIPVCSKGGEEAEKFGLAVFEKFCDKEAMDLLNKAHSIWTARQDKVAAADAGRLLAQIDSEAGCYDAAQNLMKEIKTQIRGDIDFEMREKYTDELSLEQARIEAMRAIGVAYGKNQQPCTTNLNWLR